MDRYEGPLPANCYALFRDVVAGLSPNSILAVFLDADARVTLAADFEASRIGLQFVLCILVTSGQSDGGTFNFTECTVEDSRVVFLKTRVLETVDDVALCLTRVFRDFEETADSY